VSWWRGEGLFADRREAGEQLASALSDLRRQDVVVLGIPRGGVAVAAVVADSLGAPLDVVIPRKVGAPGNPELGLGAVAEGVEVLDRDLIRRLRVGEEYLRREIAAQQDEIDRRSAAYRGDRPPVPLEGKIAVVVDDGVATGGTAAAALRRARAAGASNVILAVPVAPAEAVRRLAAEADEVRVLATPEQFYAVGQWYADFPQISDDEVIALLSHSANRRGEVRGRDVDGGSPQP
jgi:putative phosphoribosyl transferase